MLLVDVRIKPSELAGFGVFAEHFIAQGVTVWEYAPGLDLSLTQEELDALSERARQVFARFGFWNSKLNRCILCFDDARYMNHSADPNTDGRRAIRDIVPGEEITYAYGRRDLTFPYEDKSDPATRSRFIAAIQDANPHVRLHAVKSLAKMGAESLGAVPALILALKDENPLTRYYAAKCLSQIGTEARDAVPGLMEALQVADPKLRYYVAKTLGKIGPEAKPAIGALRAALLNSEPEVIAIIRQTLLRIEKT